MMHECSTDILMVMAEFMRHTDQGYNALKHYTTFKGLDIQCCPRRAHKDNYMLETMLLTVGIRQQ